MRIGDRYELLSRLGQGGMGTVWRAHDELLGRDVAIKEVLLPPEMGEAERTQRYARTIREARSAARLSHPGVVTVHDVVEHDGRPWIVMELVSAPSLQSVIDAEGPLPPRRVAEIGRQMLAALRSAHAAGIVHRDVKPSNVLVTDGDDRVVVTDFGIAALEGDATLTGTGVLMGSPAYIAPERARGQSAGPAGDLWALGATLYAAVEGRSPFERSGPVSTLAAIMAEEAPPARNAGPLGGVLAGLLRRDPADRMTAAEAGRLLAQVAGGTQPDVAAWTVQAERGLAGHAVSETGIQPDVAAWTVQARQQAPTLVTAPPPAPSRRPAMVILASALAGALVVVAFGAVWLLGRTSAGKPASFSSPVPLGVRTPGPTGDQAGSSGGPTIGGSTGSPAADAPATAPAANGFPGEWTTRSDNGFSVPVPTSWIRRSDSDSRNVFYQDPSTRYLLQISTIPWSGDPQSQAQAASGDIARSFRGFRESSVVPLTYLGVPAADLSFAYDRSTGTERCVDRFFQIGGRSYAIFFRMPVEEWQNSPRYLNTIFNGFRAG